MIFDGNRRLSRKRYEIGPRLCIHRRQLVSLFITNEPLNRLSQNSVVSGSHGSRKAPLDFDDIPHHLGQAMVMSGADDVHGGVFV